VAGKLLVDGKPFGPCAISFAASSYLDPKAKDPQYEMGTRTVSGTVKPDGTFTLSTYAPADGAPEGTYQVSISKDPSDMKMEPIPVCKLKEVEIRKGAEGKPAQLDVDLESTGEKSMMGIKGGPTPGGGAPAGP
jgi:hypothetical protein